MDKFGAYVDQLVCQMKPVGSFLWHIFGYNTQLPMYVI